VENPLATDLSLSLCIRISAYIKEMPKNTPTKQNIAKMSSFERMLSYVSNYARSINESKIFAGLMIVIINIASKFVTFKLSKTVESYLKFTFSRDILVFAITWMGTRDIFISLGMTLLFIFIVDYLLNENSSICCLPQSFINEQINMLEGMEGREPTADEIKKAKEVLEHAGVTPDLEDTNARTAYKKVDESTINLQGY
jgi:hypothetical protein